MGTNITLNPRGLFTNYNTLSQVDPGALLKANNLNIDEKGIIKPRRGIKYYSSLFSNTSHRAKQLLEYKGRIIRHVEDKLAYDDGSGLFTDFIGNYSNAATNIRLKGLEYKGNFYFTSNSGIKKISAKTTSDITNTSIQDTGAKVSTGLSVSLVADTSGFIGATQKTAYKTTWGYTDKNNLLMEGVPSYKVEAINETPFTTFSVECKIIIPQGTLTTDVFKLYRTETRTSTEDLSEEYRLVFEGSPTSGEITQGYLTYIDRLPENFRNAGVALYTNQYSGEGGDAINYRPPFATDIALYQNYIFYANVRTNHIKINTLQSIDLFSSGVTDFVVSNGTTTRTYTFQGLPEISTITCQPFSFYTNGDYFLLNSANNFRRYFVYLKTAPTVTVPTNADTVGRIGIEVDIQGTVSANDVATQISSVLNLLDDFDVEPTLNIVTITNTANGNSDAVADSTFQPTNLVFATFQQGLGEDTSTNKALLQSTNLYRSKLQALDETARSLVNCINSDPLSFVTALYLGNGKISFIALSMNDVEFFTNSNDNAIKSSWFPNLSATLNPSNNNKAINGIYFSKLDEPESVPLFNQLLVGSSDEPILRIISLRESLFIFKTDGLYRLSGYSAQDFSITLFDSTNILKAPDSAVTLRNQIYSFGTQGITRVSEGGSEKISEPIDDKLIPYITTNSNLDKLTFAVSYETDQSYMIWTALKVSDTTAQVAYRYNLYTDSWTEWQLSKTCAVLNSNEDKLYFGSGIAPTLEIERKNFDRFDSADREITITLPALSMIGNIIKPSGASQIDAGDIVYQSQGVTLYQFNQILTMLNTDPSIPSNNFLDYKINTGESMSVRMAALVGHLNTVDSSGFTDSHGNTSYVYSGATNIVTQQSEWFKIIDRINQSPTFFFSVYPKYDRITSVEARVISRDISNNDIYLSQEYPFLEGEMLVYKAITTEVEFVPQAAGDPSGLKQFNSCQIIFANRSINTAQIGFNSDLSADFQYVDFAPNSAGTWGNFPWGDGAIWGGEGDKAPLRTYVPARKQRCRFIGLRFKHLGALESFELYGLSLSYNSNSDRAYK